MSHFWAMEFIRLWSHPFSSKIFKRISAASSLIKTRYIQIKIEYEILELVLLNLISQLGWAVFFENIHYQSGMKKLS